jgi:quinol monooxygenase YgiN
MVVEFNLKPGQHAAFDRIIREHARRTLEEEPGCERFDVLQPVGRDGAPDQARVLLCEIYRDQVAVDEHGKDPRLATVRDAYAPLIENRRLTLRAM